MSKLTSQVESPPQAGGIELPPQNCGAMRYFWRAMWLAIRLAAVLVLIHQGSTFFYQGF
jgi:hypothetical protein